MAPPRSSLAAKIIGCFRIPVTPEKQRSVDPSDIIFLAQILSPNASLSVGPNYKDFYIRKP